ncbi:MAG: hypothetical protein ACI959_001910 [Limisphaerales bacterium]|jgi:hypothetical protein
MVNPIPLGDWEVLTIPFVQKGNLLLVGGTIDGQLGKFILDFGAPYLVLNSTWFREGKTISEELASGLSGSPKSVHRTEIKKLQIQDLYYEDVQADIADLREI